MADRGNSNEVKVRDAHLGWGTHRHTNSRERRPGEAYIKIPTEYARRFQLLNQNGTNHQDILGKNLFNCTSKDGSYLGQLKAQGCNFGGDIYAKQFSEKGNLKALGTWYEEVGASAGDTIQVTFTSDTDICIELIKK